MKVISTPNVTNWSKRHTCTNCDSELEIELSHLTYESDRRNGGDFCTKCPICKNYIYVMEGEIPKILKIKILNNENQKNAGDYYNK